MTRSSENIAPKLVDSSCAIARSLGVLGERWTMMIVRDALGGSTRFLDFQKSLGVAPDVLTDRLATLVRFGVLERVPYQEPGSRSRFEYHVTPAGRQLQMALMALQQWGDEYLPHPAGPSLLRRRRGTDLPVHVAFVDADGHEVDVSDFELVRAILQPASA